MCGRDAVEYFMYTLKIWNLGCIYVFHAGNLNIYWGIGRLKTKFWPKIQLSIKSHLYWKLSMLNVSHWWGHKSTSVMQIPAIRKKAACWMPCPILVHFRNVLVTFCFQISSVPWREQFSCLFFSLQLILQRNLLNIVVWNWLFFLEY